MDAIRKALAVMAKDLRVVSQDRAYVISMIIFPVLIALLNSMSSGGSQGIHLPVIIVNQDSGEYGLIISNVLEQIPELDLERLDTPDQAEQEVASGGPLAAVIIPVDFSQRIDSYQRAEITLILDPAQVSYGRIVTTILDEISASLAIQGEIRYGIRQVLADGGVDLAADAELARAAQAQVEGGDLHPVGADGDGRADQDRARGDQRPPGVLLEQHCHLDVTRADGDVRFLHNSGDVH